MANHAEQVTRDIREAAVTASPVAKPSLIWNRNSGQAVLANGCLELIVEAKTGVNARSLRDLKSGHVYADLDYSWPGGAFPSTEKNPVITNHKDGSRSVLFAGRLGSIMVEQSFTAPVNEPGVILERITIRNATASPVATADFKCGFAKRICEADARLEDAADVRFCPVPYRRETNGKMQEFPLREVAEHGMSYGGWTEPPHQTPVWGAEGWVWSKGKSAFLLAKHNPTGMEWSLMESDKRGTETVVRFGGAGQWKHGHPEGSARLDPGKSYQFGETRLQAVDGDWKQAYYAYRRYTESKGCTTPNGYSPPVHWNELYDNEYYFKCCALCEQYINPERTGILAGFFEPNHGLLAKYYSLPLMLAEAAKAKELGRESLYMDPGWDTGPNQQVWDAERLGPMRAFKKRIRDEYGLKVSLWCALGDVPPSYGDPGSCPPEARVLDKNGKPTELLCFASPAFLETKEKRLTEVCQNGAVFLMFDSDQYSGPCHDATHGHAVPGSRETHARALLELIHRLKQHCPKVLIELHDPISGPCGIHYTPTYYGYAQPRSFDCLWGHEFMWSPMDDILSCRAVSLYYYNLAYSIPLYLHVNLKTDNENALVFWWFASTCRHLGVGGKPEAKVWEAEKQAMRTYMPLKRFYTQGVFYGVDETVHAHTLPDIRESVINVFNLESKPEEKELRFRITDIGLPSGAAQVEGASFSTRDDEVILKVPLRAAGHQLVKIKMNGRRTQ